MKVATEDRLRDMVNCASDDMEFVEVKADKPEQRALAHAARALLQLLAKALVLLILVGCASPDTTCGGIPGQHCGCAAEGCVEPCVSCCPTMPCPVEGCAP